MKTLTQEEAKTYSTDVWSWGAKAGLAGLGGGLLLVGALNRFHPRFRTYDLSIKASLPLYPAFLGAMAGASYGEHLFQRQEHPCIGYLDAKQRTLEAIRRDEAPIQRMKEWAYDHRYKLCAATWMTTMLVAMRMMRREVGISEGQKLLQGRLVAQGSTISILLFTTAMEMRDAKKGRGIYEEVEVVEWDDPRHKRLHDVPNEMKADRM
ncbi:HIG1 domain-containing protein [Aspergillus clavatus NRRL 1]|uniref:HIG1 domain-containing protein n=1 Tax=Aspergillus clavatus (strain ATCC 1007 / CBS 513.65 / DSM 816 / NCTC 3887 / NRRL 1 / QM 1276 / 107) TaxID=344612 RepID=A1CDJ3_ASPCL|nr:uncharacterized protein ACLA_006780 [Aspergillus clavatus NRRL 1]EAW11920.1 conserved hypothetical protein [Aspergillus clavatus NRRL 1]